jgi:hypothetical protein
VVGKPFTVEELADAFVKAKQKLISSANVIRLDAGKRS